MTSHARSDEAYAPQALRLYLQGTPFVRTVDALLAENQRLSDVAEAVLNDEGASSLLQAIAREALAGDAE